MSSSSNNIKGIFEKVKHLDLYGQLGILPDADEKSIKKAYRKKSLKCHPDKNPDNPKATEEFHLLSNIFAVLSDTDTKKAYDNILNARKATEIRNRRLDAKRRKLKEDLEAREKEGENKRLEEVRLKQELEQRKQQERLRLIEEEKKRKLHEHEQQVRQHTKEVEGNVVLKVKWEESDQSVLTFDKERLITTFGVYGQVDNVVLRKKGKKCTALIDMPTRSEALNAAKTQNRISNFKIEAMDSDGKKIDLSQVASCSDASSEIDLDAFEAVVMENLRRAEDFKAKLKTTRPS